MFLDWLYVVMVLVPSLILSGGASLLVQSRFNRYSRVPSARGFTGAMAAQRLLDNAGIRDVRIVPARGYLSDHYNPVTKELALSQPVYQSTSVAAIGVATHGAGHAIQHARGYAPLKLRSALVPLASFGSNMGYIVMFLGIILLASGAVLGKWIFFAGVAIFAGFLLFQLITLPVEFDASARAKRLVVEAGIVSPAERAGIDKVLNAAALTYVAAFATSLLTLL